MMPSETSAETQRVLRHHMLAFDEGKVEAILADYAPDAVILTPEGPRRGHDEIIPFIRWALANMFTSTSTFTMIHQAIEGEVAYIVWSAESPYYSIGLGTDTFLVRGGKIVLQTFAAKLDTKGPD